MFSGGGVAMVTGVLERNEGLEADDVNGVLGRSSLAKPRGGAMAMQSRPAQLSSTS